MREIGAVRDIKEHGRCVRTIMLIDHSNSPGSNNRSAKVGNGNQTFAGAIMSFDSKTKNIGGGDGTSDEIVRYPFEPDNWIFRHHAKGFDTVWAVRLTVDKTNKAKELKNRSTHVISQDEQQIYGNFADLFWICKTGVSTEFSVLGSGIASAGNGTRDALALSCAENEGFISDGEKFGQLAHVFCFLEEDVPTPSGGGKKPGVPTTGGGGGPQGGQQGVSSPGSNTGNGPTPGHGSTTGGLDTQGNVVGGINQNSGVAPTTPFVPLIGVPPGQQTHEGSGDPGFGGGHQPNVY